MRCARKDFASRSDEGDAIRFFCATVFLSDCRRSSQSATSRSLIVGDGPRTGATCNIVQINSFKYFAVVRTCTRRRIIYMLPSFRLFFIGFVPRNIAPETKVRSRNAPIEIIIFDGVRSFASLFSIPHNLLRRPQCVASAV